MATTTPTYDDFVSKYPQFDTMDQPQVELQLELSIALLEPTAWGDFYSHAICLDCAHNLVLANLAGTGVLGAMQAAAGPVTSVSAAGMSSSFSSVNTTRKSDTENWYMKTIYGQQFLRLRNACIPQAVLSI